MGSISPAGICPTELEEMEGRVLPRANRKVPDPRKIIKARVRITSVGKVPLYRTRRLIGLLAKIKWESHATNL